VLLERTSDGGRKILISGGGRCNVLPSRLDPSRFVTESSPNTLRKLLLSWPLPEQRDFFERRMGLALELEEETGKLFPASHRARDVRDGLVRLAREAGVDVRFGVAVAALDAASAPAPGASPGDVRWIVRCDGGAAAVPAHAVVLATGGLSVPATGSDGAGLRIARALGHTMHDTYPALTPLTADPPVHAPLAGISLTVELSAPLGRGAFRTAGGFLFTHRGYSGPAVLDISHLAARPTHPPQTFLVRWTEHEAAALERELTEPGGGTVGAVVRRLLPQRLADALMMEAEVPAGTPRSQLRKDARSRLVATLSSYELPWTGDEGYRKAEVTGGGVALDQIDPRTLESRRHAGLHLCGEMLDAFGPIGGYNFAWAFATGRLAGRGARGGDAPSGRRPGDRPPFSADGTSGPVAE
jgi:hypothetical protein